MTGVGGPRLIDVEHLGRPRAIGAWIVDERILVDPGPACSLPRLLERLGGWRPEAIALTHIHLDHAGAAGGLLARSPGAEVWVHERGAPHLVDPSRLVRSARRVYGPELERLWGSPEAVAPGAVRIVADGERRGRLEVARTPGHAAHHVSYLDRDSGTAFVGDVAGVRIAPSSAVLAPTVAPDFDPWLWLGSLERIRAWRPSSLALTHFGRHEDVERQLAAVGGELRELLRIGADEQALLEHVARALAAGARPEDVAAYEQAAQPRTFAAGIARYLQRRPRAGSTKEGVPDGPPRP